MTLYLENVIFENDFFYIDTPDGGLLTLNRLNESMKARDEMEAEVKGINIELQKPDGDILPCSCIIGLSNDLLDIQTDHKELEGAPLTSENMKYCVINIYE